MTSEAEKKPHVVYNKALPALYAIVCPSYSAAFVVWKSRHNFKDPWEIAVLGRHCTPAAEVVDVSE